MARFSYEEVQLVNAIGCSFAPEYYAALCSGLSTYDNLRAHGVDEPRARYPTMRAAAMSALGTYASGSGDINDYSIPAHVGQAAVIAVSSESPALGAVLGVLIGNGFNAKLPEALAVRALQFEAEHYLAKWAEKRGLTLQEVTILLALDAKASKWLAETGLEEDRKTGDQEVARMDKEGVDPTNPHWFMALYEAHFVGKQNNSGLGGAQGLFGLLGEYIPGANYAGLVVDGLDVNPSGFAGWTRWVVSVVTGVPIASMAQVDQLLRYAP